MSFYHKMGKIPPKRHITMYKDDGKSLYREEHVSAKGFSSIYSNKYHLYMPTSTKNIREIEGIKAEEWKEAPLQHFHFLTDKEKPEGNFITARKAYLTNANCTLYTAHITENSGIFFRNAWAYEYIFFHKGTGEFRSDYGNFLIEVGDQIIIPQGTIYNIQFDSPGNTKLLIVESDTPYDIPSHYRNEYGQLLEDAPFCERDIKVPDKLEIHDEKGDYPLWLKAGSRMYEYLMAHHPLDVVGWDGHYYPFAFNIKNFDPKVGRVHLPPPVHLVFTTGSFVLCNFCPRPYDFHPRAIPAPYYHANIDSAEVLYYVDGDFMSRKGVGPGSITLHPLGIPHGPQPGKTEASIGKPGTEEYAVMVDTFGPLFPTTNVKDAMDENYPYSWLEI